jgi:hypothetical protein
LIWLFQLRDQSEFTVEELRMVVASALRRSPTLYWWLLKAEVQESLINEEVTAALAASDRDKSDASASIMEVAALYLDDAQLKGVIKAMRESRYSHFRDEAGQWAGRSAALGKIRKRIKTARLDNQPILDVDVNALERSASDFASRLSRGKSLGASRRLADVTRAIWAKRSKASPL